MYHSTIAYVLLISIFIFNIAEISIIFTKYKNKLTLNSFLISILYCIMLISFFVLFVILFRDKGFEYFESTLFYFLIILFLNILYVYFLFNMRYSISVSVCFFLPYLVNLHFNYYDESSFFLTCLFSNMILIPFMTLLFNLWFDVTELDIDTNTSRENAENIRLQFLKSYMKKKEYDKLLSITDNEKREEIAKNLVIKVIKPTVEIRLLCFSVIGSLITIMFALLPVN